MLFASNHRGSPQVRPARTDVTGLRNSECWAGQRRTLSRRKRISCQFCESRASRHLSGQDPVPPPLFTQLASGSASADLQLLAQCLDDTERITCYLRLTIVARFLSLSTPGISNLKCDGSLRPCNPAIQEARVVVQRARHLVFSWSCSSCEPTNHPTRCTSPVGSGACSSFA